MMINYLYKGKRSNGEKVKGYMDAPNKDALNKVLLSEGIYLTKVYRNYQIKIKHKIKITSLLFLIQEWLNLEKAKVTTQNALEIIKDNCTDKYLKLHLQSIIIEMHLGRSLVVGFNKCQQFFPELFISQINIAIERGTVVDTLEMLYGYYKDYHEQKQKISKALLYPKLLLVIFLIVFVVLCTFIVPSFIEMFNGLDLNSSFSFKMLKALNYIGENILLFFIIIISIILTITLLFKVKKVKNIVDFILVKILNKYFNIYFTYIFTTILNLYWHNKINKFESLSYTINITKNVYYKSRIKMLIEEVRVGKKLGEAINNTQLFNNVFCKMIISGEENDYIEESIVNAQAYYKSRFNNMIESIIKLIEPLMLIIMGGFVVFLIMIIFIPLMNGFKVVM